MVFGQILTTSTQKDDSVGSITHCMVSKLLVLPCSKTKFHGCFEGYVPQICWHLGNKQVDGQPELTPSYSNTLFVCVLIAFAFPEPSKVMYWNVLIGKHAFSFSEWCNLPRAAFVCFSDEFRDPVINYFSYQQLSLLHQSSPFNQWRNSKFHMIPNDMESNDMKIQIVKSMIWTNFHINFHFKLPHFSTGMRNPEPLSWSTYLS